MEELIPHLIENIKNYADKSIKDLNLIALAYLKNDERAFGELMERHRKSLYHTMLKMIKNTDDAEDLTLEAFAKAFRSLDKFKKEFTFSTWLFRIASNNAIDFIRKKKLETLSITSAYTDESGEDVGLDIKDESLDPQEEAIKSQKTEIMLNFVGRLPVKYQRLVDLRFFQELSYEEISEKINIPLGTVKAQLHRAKELLYDLIKNRRDFM